MVPYLQKALRQFDNLVPTHRHDSLYPHIEPKYGAKQQYAEYDTSAPVGKDEQKHVQLVMGKFNWYARGVDGTLLTPISALSAQQAKPAQATMKRVEQFLDYAATQEPAVNTYRVSDMVLAINSDAGYLNSLTPKFVLAGTKNSLSEGFLLAKHKHTNIPTMMEPFAPPAAWFCRSSIPHPREPLQKGLAEASVEGI